MPETPALRTVSSPLELIGDVGVDIVGVTFFEVSARVRENSSPESDEFDGAPQFQLAVRADPGEIGIRVRLTVETDIGEAKVDAAIVYAPLEPVIVPPSVLLEFANEVGLMGLLPYIREALSSTTLRVFGTAVIMPVYQRGELHFEDDGTLSGANQSAGNASKGS